MREDTIVQLRKISTPKQFAQNDYICYEGQPGNEMYIILKGSIGVFLTSAIGTLNQVATIGSGDFFGEMAIFDDLPRSASCIALEDTIAVAITKKNLQEFLATCPEIAGQMLEKMSGRIRKLDNELYKNNRFVKNRHVPKFEIPVEFKQGHAVKKAYQDPQLVQEYKQACPICGKAVSAVGLKRKILEEKEFHSDCRIVYAGCDPLWLEVLSCSHCYYSNHYLRFFGLNNFEYEVVNNLLAKEHKPVVESRIEKRSDFDILIMRYLQAININEHINPGDHVLLGGMWRNIFWLCQDISETDFARYSAKKAADKFKAAFEENQFADAISKTSTALSLASILVYIKEYEDALPYANIAVECTDEKIKNKALQVQALVQRRIENK